jgi:hypothetical protein
MFFEFFVAVVAACRMDLRRRMQPVIDPWLQLITDHYSLIAWAEGNYGRGQGVGCGELGVGTGVMRGGAVGRGTGVPELVRGVGVGRVGGSG